MGEFHIRTTRLCTLIKDTEPDHTLRNTNFQFHGQIALDLFDLHIRGTKSYQTQSGWLIQLHFHAHVHAVVRWEIEVVLYSDWRRRYLPNPVVDILACNSLVGSFNCVFHAHVHAVVRWEIEVVLYSDWRRRLHTCVYV